jgi:hypothetical protein
LFFFFFIFFASRLGVAAVHDAHQINNLLREWGFLVFSVNGAAQLTVVGLVNHGAAYLLGGHKQPKGNGQQISKRTSETMRSRVLL